MEVAESQDPSLPAGWRIVVPPDPHQPKMSADTTAPHANPDAVTFQDVVDDPQAAFSKIGATLKRDLSDPRTWTMAAALYFGPKVVNAVLPIAREAAATGGAPGGGPSMLSRVGAAMKAGAPDLIKSIAGYRVGHAVDAIQKIGGVLSAEPVAAAPEAAPATAGASAASPAAASTPGAPVPPAAEAASTAVPQSTATAPPSALSPQQRLNEEALAARRAAYQATQATEAAAPAVQKPALLASETKEFVRLIQAGKTQKEALAAIQVQRDLQAQLGLKTPTAAETRFPKGNRGKVVPQGAPEPAPVAQTPDPAATPTDHPPNFPGGYEGFRAHVNAVAEQAEARVTGGANAVAVKVGGRNYDIPQRWLQGRSRTLETQGVSPKDALKQAVQDWVDQARMAVGGKAPGDDE